MIGRLTRIAGLAFCHRSLYFGLTGCHVWASVATQKPEVYLPMAAIYFALGCRG